MSSRAPKGKPAQTSPKPFQTPLRVVSPDENTGHGECADVTQDLQDLQGYSKTLKDSKRAFRGDERKTEKDEPPEVAVSKALRRHQDRFGSEEVADLSPLWEFVRSIKGIHSIGTKDGAGEAFKKVSAILKRFLRGNQMKSDTDAWSYYLGVSQEEAEAEFFEVWDKIRLLPGETPLHCAAEFSRRSPLGIKREVAAKRPSGYPKFISFAGWLQVVAGNTVIMLPCHDVGAILGVTGMTVSRYRRWAVEDGYLLKVKDHSYRGRGAENEATEFRFNVGLWTCLQQAAESGTEESYDEAARQQQG